MPTALTTRKLNGHTCVEGEERAGFSEDRQRQSGHPWAHAPKLNGQNIESRGPPKNAGSSQLTAG